jgi:hypothetical protein
MEESEPLVPPTQQNENPSARNRGRATLVVAGAVFLLGLCVAILDRSDVTAKKDTTATMMSATEMGEMKNVFELLANRNVSSSVTCHSSTYAYCGSATCKIANERTVICGCELKESVNGKFDFGKASLILIKSKLFRRAVSAIDKGNFYDADLETEFCNGLSDGSLFRSAGFDSDLGSFYFSNSTSDDDDGTSSAETALMESTRATSYMSSEASCMGSPCKTLHWGGGCTTTCACNYYKEVSSSPARSCFTNGVLTESRTYGFTSSLDRLLAYVDSAANVIKNLHDIVEELEEKGSKKVCDGSCSVTTQ